MSRKLYLSRFFLSIFCSILFNFAIAESSFASGSARRNIEVLSVSTPIPNQTIEAGQQFNFKIPEGTFTGDDFILRAKLSNGDPLPRWLQFHLDPEFVSNLDLGSCSRVEVSGDKAYLVCGTQLKIVDISDPYDPEELGSCALSGGGQLLINGTYAYVSSSAGLDVVDISNSASPSVTGTCTDVSYVGYQIAYYNQHIYIPAANDGVDIVDVSNPSGPFLANTVDTGQTYDISISGDYAYTSDGGIFDVANTTVNPNPIGYFPLRRQITTSENLVLSAWYGTNILDMTDIHDAKIMSNFVKHNTITNSIHNSIYQDYVFIEDFGMHILDISDQNHVTYCGKHDLTDRHAFYKQYFVSNRDGLTIKDLSKARLVGTPSTEDVGTITVKVIADNMQGQTVETTFDIEVTSSQFTLPTTTPCAVVNQTESHIALDNGNLYCLDKIDNDLQIDLGCNGAIDSTIPDFKNGEQSIQLPNRPAVVKPDFKISQYTKGGIVYGDVIALNSTHFVASYFAAKPNCYDGDFDFYGQIIDTEAQTQSSYFQINTSSYGHYLPGFSGPRVIKLNNGNFVVTWKDGNGGIDIHGYSRIFDANGSEVVSEFLSCGAHYDSQTISATRLETGFAVSCADGYGYRNLNIYNSSGVLQGDSIHVDEDGGKDDTARGNILGLNNGNILVTSAGGNILYARIFKQDGTVIKSKWQVNDFTDYANYPTAVLLNNGNFLILWIGYDGENEQMLGSIFTEAGVVVRSNFLLTTSFAYYKLKPHATVMENGNVFIVWYEGPAQGSNYASGNGYEIYGAIIDQSGNVVAERFRVNTYMDGHQICPRVSHPGSNKVIVTWTNEDLSGSPEIYGTILDANNLTSSPYHTCLKGTDGNDQLLAPGAALTDSIVVGGAGNDTLGVQNGNNVTISGGPGYDKIVIYPTNNQVNIVDFDPNKDVLDLSNISGVTSISNFNMTQSGNNTIIDLGSGKTITLKNVDKDDLKGDDFIGEGGDPIVDFVATNLNQSPDCNEDNHLDLDNIQIQALNQPITATLTLSNPLAGNLTTGTTGSTTSTFNAGVWSAAGPTSEVNNLLASAQFQPTENYNTDFNIGVLIKDSLLQELTGQINVNMIPVNDEPTITDIPKIGRENVVLTFTSTDFTGVYSDVEGSGMTQIQVLTLPNALHGTLKLSSTPVSENQVITTANLSNLNFDPATNWYGPTTFSWRAYDGESYSSSANVNITIKDMTAITTTPSILDYTENAGAAVIDSGLTLVDSDTTDLTGATVSITGNLRSSEDSLNFINQLGITMDSYNSGTGTLTLTGTSSVANYQTALRSVTYTNSSENPASINRTISFQVTDGVDSSNIAERTINVIGVNDKPVITDVLKTGTTNIDVTFSSTDFTGVYTDLENHSMTQIQILSLPNAGHGVLKLSSSPVSTDQVILTANLGNLAFEPNTDWYGSTGFSWQAYDGNLYSDPANVSITIEDPTVITTTVSTLNYTENAGAVVVDGALTIEDGDTANLTGATISIGNLISSEDSLSFTSQFGITGVYNDTTGELPLTGTASVANYQTVLRSIAYTNNSENPITANRIINFQVRNGADNSNIATRTISITGVNDAPTVITDIIKSEYKNNPINFAISDFTGVYEDPEDSLLAQVKVFNLPSATYGVLKLSGFPVTENQVIPRANLGNLVFEPASGWSGNTNFSWQAQDGDLYSNTASVNISINNQIPTIGVVNVSAKLGENLYFSKADFENVYSDADEDIMAGIKIQSLPNPKYGILEFNTIPVSRYEYIPSNSIDSLVFVQDPDCPGGDATFSWQAYDGTGYSEEKLAVIEINVPGKSSTSEWVTEIIVGATLATITAVCTVTGGVTLWLCRRQLAKHCCPDKDQLKKIELDENKE